MWTRRRASIVGSSEGGVTELGGERVGDEDRHGRDQGISPSPPPNYRLARTPHFRRLSSRLNSQAQHSPSTQLSGIRYTSQFIQPLVLPSFVLDQHISQASPA
ncbi:hypothetical protein NLI96_g10565 [Meripilus lineatus]|uniref:Uncharacterized protein n=1 Tax=Meripilus lineatus TaxID=2056292 RepID=A0AAD5YBV1_9APHY|nr:hypothetical protein NLI96_g10565 [Physisporinus lineatus]